MINKNLRLGLMILAIGFSQLAQAESIKITRGETKFLAVGKPGFLRINGEGGTIDGSVDLSNEEVTSVEAIVNLDTLKTGLDLRDEHMKEKYLETGKFQKAIFKANNLKLQCKDFKKTTVSGTLELHGVNRPVTAAIEGTCAGKTFSGNAEFELTLSDYAIDIPSFAGVTVANKVNVNATFEGKVQ